MSKVTAIQKEIFRLNRNEMREDNIQWAFSRETGVTVIYQVMPEGDFIKVAVAYCNPQDTFKKKMGLNAAFHRWANDMAIQVPTFGRPASEAIAAFFIARVSVGDSVEWQPMPFEYN